ncbi:MAG: polysaccharide biosynthesis/export family protein [Bacteroidia bacterium]|nr:polysaccharide biosynthesis/export family protein [Bacteroidia bacterium]
MKNSYFNSVRYLLQIALVLFIFASCVPQKKIKYLQTLQEQDTTNAYINKRPLDYKIQPNDNLYIRIFSLDEKTYLFFNMVTSSNQNQYANDASIYLNSYTVDRDGYIDFPIVGRVLVKTLTVEQVKDVLQTNVDEYLTETMVVVKMVNFKITILGEVRSPGVLTIYQDEINIFEAIAMAGDLSDYANRKKIALVRQTTDGSKVVYLDLNKADIISSEYFYMMPNDIIYASPLGIKQWGFAAFPYALIFSAISTALLLINYFK